MNVSIYKNNNVNYIQQINIVNVDLASFGKYSIADIHTNEFILFFRQTFLFSHHSGKKHLCEFSFNDF